LLVGPFQPCLDVMSEVPHLRVHSKESLHDTCLLRFERLLFAFRDYFNVRIRIV
jgi:hypothetical protein